MRTSLIAHDDCTNNEHFTMDCYSQKLAAFFFSSLAFRSLFFRLFAWMQTQKRREKKKQQKKNNERRKQTRLVRALHTHIHNTFSRSLSSAVP